MVRGARELDVALLDLRAFPRRQQLVQRVTAFVGANPRSLFVPDTDAKTRLQEDASGHAPGCSSTSRGGAFAESGQRRGSLSPMRTN